MNHTKEFLIDALFNKILTKLNHIEWDIIKIKSVKSIIDDVTKDIIVLNEYIK